MSIYDWIQDILTLRHPAWATDEDRQARLDFAMRFQQITAPVTAKGYEDTALYRFARLISLNEVGGDPNRFGASLAEFHAAMAERQRQHPGGLSATATHDTKRGEDVRARIDVLSEVPREWRARVGAWQRLNRRHRTAVDGRPVPGLGDGHDDDRGGVAHHVERDLAAVRHAHAIALDVEHLAFEEPLLVEGFVVGHMALR